MVPPSRWIRPAAVIALAAIALCRYTGRAIAIPQSTSTFLYASIFEPLSGVDQFDAGTGGLIALSPLRVGGVSGPAGLAVSPDGTSLYVADNAANTIAQYTVEGDGTLTLKNPATVVSGAGPNRLAVSPDGTSVYVANGRDGTVSQYDVFSGGTLVPKNPPTVPAGAFPDGITVSPDGRSVYVTNRNDNTVSQYDVGAGGALVPKRPATIASATPVSIAASPNGASVYVANVDAGTVSQYDVGAGGVLAPKFPATVAAGPGSIDVVVSHDGTSVYVSNRGDSVAQFGVDPTAGTLSPKTPARVPADCFGSGIGGLAITPDDTSLYVAGAGCGVIFQYDVEPGSGYLIPKSPAFVAADGSPAYLAVTARVAAARITFSPTALSFLKQKVGTISASQTVMVANTGSSTVTISGLSIIGPDSDEFRLSGDTCSGVILNPAGSCAISVRFAPIARGPASAALRVASTAPGASDLPLEGTTKPPK